MHSDTAKSKHEHFFARECVELATCMDRKYAAYLGDRRFDIKSETRVDGVYVTVTLFNLEKSFHYPVEARMEVAEAGMTLRAAAAFMIDCVDVYFSEYLTKDGDTYLPIDWAAFECEGKTIHMRGQVFNLKLEAQADEILRQGV